MATVFQFSAKTSILDLRSSSKYVGRSSNFERSSVTPFPDRSSSVQGSKHVTEGYRMIGFKTASRIRTKTVYTDVMKGGSPRGRPGQ